MAVVAYDQETAERLRRLLQRRQDVVEKRMVGGISFSAGGAMFCGVTKEGLMVRVGAEGLERTLAEPHVQPMEFGGRRLSGFACVRPAGYPTDDALEAWVQKGLDFLLASGS